MVAQTFNNIFQFGYLKRIYWHMHTTKGIDDKMLLTLGEALEHKAHQNGTFVQTK